MLDQWVSNYNRNLRPKLRTKRFRWLDKDIDWKEIKLPTGALWAGAYAAEQLTGHIIAENLEIYTRLPFESLMKAIKIIPDNNGDITVTEYFWNDKKEVNSFIESILLYADLLNTHNIRYIETASLIYKNHIHDKL